MRTGDLGRIDPDGRLHFEGRLKEMLKTGGINVSPREIEAFLRRRPGVAEAYVVGIPDPLRREVPAAAVVPEEGAALDPERLRRDCGEAMAAYKVPKRIEIFTRETLPVTATGKVRKVELAERLAQSL